jgi:translocation and assembly module TamB
MRWNKTIGWTLGTVVGIATILLGTAYLIAHGGAFNRWVLAKVIQKAEDATGGRLTIGSMAIDWSRLAVDFNGVALYRSGGDSQPAPLQADHLRVGLKIVSLLKRTIGIEEIVLDHPVLHLVVDARGDTNLPQSRPAANRSVSPDTLFDLAIGRIAIHSGEIHYNDEEIPLSAELDNFRLQIQRNLLAARYEGSLAYEEGRITAKQFNPLAHRAQMQFRATRSELSIDPLVLETGRSRITAHAQLSDYARPSLRCSYDAAIFTQEIAHLLKRSPFPIGRVALAGTLRYEGMPKQTFLDSVYLDGRLRSPQLTLETGQVSTQVKSVDGTYLLERGSLHLENLQADLLEGHLAGAMEMLDLGGNPSSHFRASLKNVSLEALSDALPAGNLGRVRMVGSADLDTQAAWSEGLQDLLAHSHAVIRAPLETNRANSDIPLNGVVNLNYDGAHDSASLGESYLRSGKTEVSLNGTLSRSSDVSVRASTSDLHELGALVSSLEAISVTSKTTPARQAYDVRGSARFNGRVFGSVKDLRLQGQLSASQLEVRGSRWRMLRANLDLGPSGVALQDGVLEGTEQGQLSFNTRAGLEHWSFTPSSPISLHASAMNLSVADLERLGNLHYPLNGVLAANLSIDGSGQNPTGHGRLEITKASAWNEPISKLAVDFQGGEGSVRSTAQLQIPAGVLEANLTYSPAAKQYEASLRTSGIKLDQIQAVESGDLGVSGVLTVSASGRGILSDPQFTANVQIPELHVRDQAISKLQAQLTVASSRATVTLNSMLDQGSLEAKGDLSLGGEYPAAASLDVRGFPIGLLLASYMSGKQPAWKGQSDIHATLKGPLRNPSRFEAQVEISTFHLDYKSAQIALVRPLRIDYRDGVATVERTELKGNGTDLSLEGRIPVKSPAELNVAATGTADLSLLQDFGAGIKSSGRVDMNISARGNSSAPAIQGQLRVANAALSTATLPVGFEGLNAEIQVSGNRIEITQLAGTVGGGKVSANGFMVYGPKPSFNLGLNASSLRVRYPEGLRSILNGNLQLNGTPQDSTLSGRVIIDRLSFTQEFDLANFIGQFGAESPTRPSSFEQNMKLNVALQSADQLNLASSKVSVEGAANLTLNGTLADPVILGRATLSGGDIFFMGKRYEVQNGMITFSNPVRTEPVLNFYVTTTVEQYKITLNFVGPVDRLRTNYTSDPALPPADIINLLALGKTAEESATSSTPASVGAESVLARGVSQQVSGRLEKLTGVSQLTIDPMTGGNQQDPGAQVAIQQRVTGSILLTFSTNVTSTQSQTVQVQYQPGQTMSLSILRDQNGGYALDVRIHKVF